MGWARPWAASSSAPAATSRPLSSRPTVRLSLGLNLHDNRLCMRLALDSCSPGCSRSTRPCRCVGVMAAPASASAGVLACFKALQKSPKCARAAGQVIFRMRRPMYLINSSIYIEASRGTVGTACPAAFTGAF